MDFERLLTIGEVKCKHCRTRWYPQKPTPPLKCIQCGKTDWAKDMSAVPSSPFLSETCIHEIKECKPPKTKVTYYYIHNSNRLRECNCDKCGSGENLQMHHISYEPEITIPLCVDCHLSEHNYEHGVGVPREMCRQSLPSVRDKFLKSWKTGKSYFESIVMKVWKNNTNQQLLITIPKKSDIEEGDYVEIKKI